MIEELEERTIGSPVLFMGQDRDVVAAVANNKVIFEAPIQLPSGAGEAGFYLLRVQFAPLSRGPT